MTISPAYSSSPAYMESTLSGLQRAADSIRAARAARPAPSRATSNPAHPTRPAALDPREPAAPSRTSPPGRPLTPEEVLDRDVARKLDHTPDPGSDLIPAERALYRRAWPNNESEKR